MELEFEAEDVAQGLVLAHVGLYERYEELVLVWTAFVHLQNDVQHSVWVQVKASCAIKHSKIIKSNIHILKTLKPNLKSLKTHKIQGF